MNSDSLAQLTEVFALGPGGALGIVILMALESLPVIGLFLPGIVIMVGLGSLSGTDYLSFADCVLYASIGALIGDSIGFWLGRLGIKHRLLHPGNRRTRDSRARARILVERHGRLGVFLGRFVWVFHPAVPFIAGAAGIRPGGFYLADVPAVILWVLIYGGIGHWATGMAREQTLTFMIGVGVVLVLLGGGLLLRYLWRRRHHRPGTESDERAG